MVIAVRVVFGRLILIATAKFAKGELVAPVYGTVQENQEHLIPGTRRIRDKRLIFIDDLCSASYAQDVDYNPTAMLDFPSLEETETNYAPVYLRALRDLTPGEAITIRYIGETPQINQPPMQEIQDYAFGLSQPILEEDVPLLELQQSPPLLSQPAPLAPEDEDTLPSSQRKTDDYLKLVIDLLPLAYASLNVQRLENIVSVYRRNTETAMLVLRKRIRQNKHCVLTNETWTEDPGYAKSMLLLEIIVFEWYFNWVQYETLEISLSDTLFDMSDFGETGKFHHVQFTRPQIESLLLFLEEKDISLKEIWHK